jgi:hypothetical protein
MKVTIQTVPIFLLLTLGACNSRVDSSTAGTQSSDIINGATSQAEESRQIKTLSEDTDKTKSGGLTSDASTQQDRAWRAYEEMREELRWYEFCYNLWAYGPDENRTKWPMDFVNRKNEARANLEINVLALQGELEKARFTSQTAIAVVEEWERTRSSVKEARIAYIDDIFSVVFKTQPPKHMAPFTPIRREGFQEPSPATIPPASDAQTNGK